MVNTSTADPDVDSSVDGDVIVSFVATVVFATAAEVGDDCGADAVVSIGVGAIEMGTTSGVGGNVNCGAGVGDGVDGTGVGNGVGGDGVVGGVGGGGVVGGVGDSDIGLVVEANVNVVVGVVVVVVVVAVVVAAVLGNVGGKGVGGLGVGAGV